jgi:hypothetical protein
MKSIKHVKSMDKYSCSIACLAMIARVSYFEMREKLSRVSPRQHKKVMDHTDLQLYADEQYDILKTHLGIRCRGVKFIPPMKNHCILLIAPINLVRSGHAVVWDAKQQKILDPDSVITNLDDFNIYYCIEILSPKTGLEIEQRNEEKYWRFNGIGPRVRLSKYCKLEYILQDLLLTEKDAASLSRDQRIALLTKAIGLTELEIKQKLSQLQI